MRISGELAGVGGKDEQNYDTRRTFENRIRSRTFLEAIMIRLAKVAFVAAMSLAAAELARAQQDLRVGLMDAEPVVVRNNNQLGARDIDVWTAIAEDTGIRVTYVFVKSPSALLTALDEGKVDAAGWTQTTAAKYRLTTILPTAEA